MDMLPCFSTHAQTSKTIPLYTFVKLILIDKWGEMQFLWRLCKYNGKSEHVKYMYFQGFEIAESYLFGNFFDKGVTQVV